MNETKTVEEAESFLEGTTAPEMGTSDDASNDAHLYAPNQHPLLKDNAILPTRALEEFVNTVRLWLDNLLPGSIVYGLPRVGKTQAIQFLLNNVRQMLGSPIPVSLISCWEYTYQGTTENRFFTELLHVLRYEMPKSGTAAVKRRRAIDFMVERANEAKEHRYLLFVDEAQWLSEAHYRFLMDLHNQLKTAGIRLVVILVGQPELMDIRDNFKSARKRHLLGRFMTDVHRFSGIDGETDFRRLFVALDVGSEFPSGSGVSFTQFFLPKAYAAGWRFAEQSGRIWKVLERTCSDEGVPTTRELPMQPLIACIRWLMQTLSHMDEEDFELNDALIQEAIYRVALLQIQDYASQEELKVGE